MTNAVEPRATIYDDVAALQDAMALVQSDITSLKESVQTLTAGMGEHETLANNIAEISAVLINLENSVSTTNGAITGLESTVSNLTASVEDLSIDSGWISMPLNSGWSMTDYAGEIPMYRKVGKVVYLKGIVSGTASAAAIIATLPVGFRPAANSFNRYACPVGQDGFVNVQVGKNGQISDYNKNATTMRTFIALSGICFLAE